MADRSLVAGPGKGAATPKPSAPSQLAAPSLFDQVPAVYAFCREHLFRDDTERIVAALWPTGGPPSGARLLELGCGPGFYARRLAAQFPALTVIGLDRSIAQLAHAEARLAATALPNCHFDLGDAARLPYPDYSLDAIVAARLLGSVEARDQVIAEVHRVLAPGGRCFVAEPMSRLRAAVPVVLMRIAARVGGAGEHPVGVDASQVTVLDEPAFEAIVHSQSWARASRWVDGHYQYAVLEKAAGQ